jgi:hypothetical protein
MYYRIQWDQKSNLYDYDGDWEPAENINNIEECRKALKKFKNVFFLFRESLILNLNINQKWQNLIVLFLKRTSKN